MPALTAAGESRLTRAALSGPADHILPGRILTFDSNDSVAEAFAVEDGMIVGTGARAW